VTVFEEKGNPFTAILRGVSSSGSLLLEDETGRVVEFNSGEIKMNYEN
jgi:biotin-(acetyl-CoA carboxylase) ligase